MIRFTLVAIIWLFFGAELVSAQKLSDVIIYVNPGHGGYDADDRNVTIAPFAAGDHNGFWESKSNLDKGLRLRDLLQQAGATVIMSRVTNTSADDRNLTTIAEEANVNQSDFMISIHSNALNGSVNYPLMLFHGWDGAPIKQASLDVANLFWDNLHSNQTSFWTYNNRNVRGDKSFAPESWNGYGVLRPLTVPGLISEGSFHDYIPETYRLMSLAYKRLEAWHFYKAFVSYFGIGADTKGKIAGYVKDSYSKVQTPYYYPGSPDQFLPVNGATVTLNPGGLTYTVDNLFNGIYMFEDLEPGTYELVFSAPGYDEQIIQAVTVEANKVTYKPCALAKTRNEPLQVISYSPQVAPGHIVSAGTTIGMAFNYELDRTAFELAFSIVPAINGVFQYSNEDRAVSFIPELPFETSTVYTITLSKDARHIGNLPMDDDFTFEFTTGSRNRLKVLDVYPNQGYDKVTLNSGVKIYFDGKIQTTNIANLIQVRDESGVLVTSANAESNTALGDNGSHYFRMSNLVEGKIYNLSIDPLLKDVDNLPLDQAKQYSFSVNPIANAVGSIVDDFEVGSQWSLAPTNSWNIDEAYTRMLRYSTLKFNGTYSYRLLYSFKEQDAAAVVKYNSPSIQLVKNDHLGVYLFGDYSLAELSIIVNDGVETLELPFTTIDFAGWQFKSVFLSTLGSNTYTLVGFKLKSVPGTLSATGFLLFDKMMVSKEYFTSVTPAFGNAKFSIYPNPVVNELFIIPVWPDKVVDYHIYNMEGKRVKQGQIQDDNCSIDLTNLSAGHYLFVVNSSSMQYTNRFVKQ
jgi:N-acetylmuramoyl-L-alanine amidase